MNIPQECNNPVNLMLAKPAGECTEIRHVNTKTGLGYCYFPTPQAGWRAAFRQYDSDVKRGLTISQYIFKFAPPNENDTNAYLEFVCKEIGCTPSTKLDCISKYALAGVQAQMEGYYSRGK